MTKFFLCLHVLAAVLAVGPVTVAASMFPSALRRAHSEPGKHEALASVRLLHRICRVYATLGMALVVFGFATASSLGVLGSPWLITSILLTASAAAMLSLLILPAQDRALDAVQDSNAAAVLPEVGRLAMLTGVFNLLWATVTVLMIVRPGSTTGV